MRIRFALLVVVLLGISGIAFGFPSMMMVGGGSGSAPLATQATTALSPTSCTYPFGSASGTLVCNMTAMMSPPTPAFLGTFSGSTAQFAVNSATGAITLAENDQCSSSPCNYSLPVTATPSNPAITPFTQTITITSSSGPSVPAAANAGCLTINGGGPTNGSCFSTLALNLDFTTPGTVSGYSNGSKFSAQTQANWLNCGGGTSTYNVMGVSAGNGSSGSPTAPCSDFPITTDSGGSVLQMTITPSDVSAGAGSWTMFSEHSIPANFYAEVRMRTPNSNYNPSATLAGDFWSYTSGTAPPCLENDFIEWTLSAATAGANACNATLEQHNWSANGVTFDPTNYHTYGERITGDGNGNVSYCFYKDETQVNIETYLTPTGNCGARGPDAGFLQNYLTAISLLLQVGQEDTNTITDNILYYVQWVRLWDCSNWTNATPGTGSGTGTGNQCTGVVLNSNP